MQLNELQRTTKNRKQKRVGRGRGSGKGKTSGRGTKGQKARTGGRGGLKLKGLKQNLLKVPKSRGFKSHRPQPATVTLGALNRHYEAGAKITPGGLAKDKVVSTGAAGVKIVATGEIGKALTVSGCLVSKTAAAAIEKAGGKIVY